MKLNLCLLLLLGVTACNSQSIDSSPSLNPSLIPSSTSTVGIEQAAQAPFSVTVKQPSHTGNVALVWNGTGACTDGCAQGAADSAAAAGLVIRYVNDQTAMTTPEEISAVFSSARVWVMPGGKSTQEVSAMSSQLIQGLRDFISEGGGYVGFCAGAFSATEWVGTSGELGLGIFPGGTELYNTRNNQNSYGASIEKLSWENTERSFYFEGGPFLKNLPSSVEIVAFYDDQSVAAARTNFGKGRVFITGVHPEAPTWWWSGTSIDDPDGSDQSYAADMIRWAASL